MCRLACPREHKPVAKRAIFDAISADLSLEVSMLDLFYVAIVIAFFFLLWAFTKAADRL